MSYTTITFNGTTFNIPSSSDPGNWAAALNTFLQAVASDAAALNVVNTFTATPIIPGVTLAEQSAPSQLASAAQVYCNAADGYMYTIPALNPGSNPSTPIRVGAQGVTSVGMTVPGALLTVSGSPVTGSGTLAVTLPSQSANTVFAGPASGGSATPTFRALTIADVPGAVGITFAAKTANYPILTTDNGTRFSNAGAAGSVQFTLPTVAAGLEFTFAAVVGFSLTVTGGTFTGPGGMAGTTVTVSVSGTSSPNRYTSFKLGCYDGSTWLVQELNGAIIVS